MKASTANLFNAVVLILAGVYGYFILPAGGDAKSPTALIPAVFGIIFLLMQKGVAAHNKAIAHIVVLLTLLLLVMCAWRFLKVPDWNAKKYLFLVCVASNAIALIAFIGSFVAARRKK